MTTEGRRLIFCGTVHPRKRQAIPVSLFFSISCVSFCTGHFVMVPLIMTYLHCLQQSLFEHLFNLYLIKQEICRSKHYAFIRWNFRNVTKNMFQVAKNDFFLSMSYKIYLQKLLSKFNCVCDRPSDPSLLKLGDIFPIICHFVKEVVIFQWYKIYHFFQDPNHELTYAIWLNKSADGLLCNHAWKFRIRTL